MENLKDAAGRARTLWLGLDRRRRLVIAGGALACLVFFATVLHFAGRVTYVPLFSGLELEDQAAIVDILNERKIPFRIDPEDGAILVPDSEVYGLRLSMAEAGLPKNGTVGYEIFDNAKMGMTDFQQQVAYVRALEGELARTIGRLDVVESARVSVVLPKPKLFLKDEQPATASVLVKLRPGRDLSPEQVRAVVKLTASSVEGLDPENVSVVDTSGRLLSESLAGKGPAYPNESGEVTSLQRELERRQEKDLELKAQNMLAAIFGPGNAVVRVRVELDFTKRNRTRKAFVPQPNGKGIVRSTQASEESYTGSAGPSQGVGTAANIPGYAVRSGNSAAGEYSKTDQVTNYEISTLQEEEEETPGKIKRITASVVINREEAGIPREALIASLSTAIGIDEKRGDRVSLTVMPFAPATDPNGKSPVQDRLGGLVFMAALVLAAAFAAVAVVVFLVRRRKRPGSSGRGEPKKAGIPERAEALFEAPKDSLQVLEEQIGLYARSAPEEAASIIKQWLEES
ncbi:MAG: flagellar basal-body MS-ring/collar protein FliF [Synergistales bacterium]